MVLDGYQYIGQCGDGCSRHQKLASDRGIVDARGAVFHDAIDSEDAGAVGSISARVASIVAEPEDEVGRLLGGELRLLGHGGCDGTAYKRGTCRGAGKRG